MMKEIEINKDILESLTRYIKDWLINSGMSEHYSKIISDYSGFLILIAFALVIFYIAKFIIIRWVHRMAERSTSNWDDAFVEHKVFKRLAYLVPALIIHTGAQYVIPDYPVTLSAVLTLIKVYMITVGMIMVKSVLLKETKELSSLKS